MSQENEDVEMSQEEATDVDASDDVSTIAGSTAKMELTSNEVRKELRDALEDMQEKRLDFIDPNSNLIEQTLAKVENIFKSVTKPREAVSEANVLYELTVLAKERIKNVKCAFRSFNNAEFMDKLKEYMISMGGNNASRLAAENQDDDDETADVNNDSDIDDDDDDDNENRVERKPKIKRKSNRRISAVRNDYALTQAIIQKFGDEVMRYFRILPRPKFVLGSIEKDLGSLAKTKKVRQQKAKTKEPEAIRTKIKELDANSKDNETNNTVSETERIFKILKKCFEKTEGKPVCLYQFMINTKSFSRTIENVFYISFLVKDGYAKVYLDDENLPVIEPIQKEFVNKTDNPRTQQKKTTENIQSMISLTKPEWEEIIKVFEIEKGLIKDPKK